MIQLWDALNMISMLIRKKGSGTSDERLKYFGITLYFGKKGIDFRISKRVFINCCYKFTK